MAAQPPLVASEDGARRRGQARDELDPLDARARIRHPGFEENPAHAAADVEEDVLGADLTCGQYPPEQTPGGRGVGVSLRGRIALLAQPDDAGGVTRQPVAAFDHS